MTKHNLKLALNDKFFDLSPEEFENKIEKSIEAGKFPEVFLYDEEGRFKGVNALPFSEAAIKLLAKIRTPKDEKDEQRTNKE